MTELPPVERLTVERTARWARLGDATPEVRELWIVLHGYRQLAARFLTRFRPLESPLRWIVAPEALNRFYVGDDPGRHGPDAKVGGTWMTREARELEIADYVAWLDRLHGHLRSRLDEAGAEGVRTLVLGFSQGAHTAARWTTLGGVAPGRIVLWAEGLPHDLDADRARERWAGVQIDLVRGETDRFHPAERVEAEGERLRSLGARPRLRTHPGGHELDTELLLGIAEDGVPEG